MNAEQAAKALGKDPGRMRRLAAAGRVQGVFKIGVAWVAEFDAWKAATEEKRRPGRKPNRLTPD